MPRFLIKRVWGEANEAAMLEHGRRSGQIGREHFPEIVWEHSHVVVGPDGQMMSFCIYRAEDIDILRKHGTAVGGHFIEEIFEISGDVSPGDFFPGPAAGDQGPR